MKRVVSISLGSSHRDHQTCCEFCGQEFSIARVGTDGDRSRAIALIRELDGQVDAFGMGGTDLYIYAGGRRYTFRESAAIAAAARQTPIVDGSGVKNTLERRVVRQLQADGICEFRDRNVLIVCAVDRFGLAEAVVEAGGRAVFGDLMFGLGLPLPIRSLRSLEKLARIAAPVITRLPISMFYPTGARQKERCPKFARYFNEAHIVAGDFHFIRRYMPDDLSGKTIITNTVTQEDQDLLKSRGVATLVTTTPDMGGRSFGTNVLEGVLVVLAGKRPEDMSPQDYEYWLDRCGIGPRVLRLN